MKLTLGNFLAIWLIVGALIFFGVAHLAHLYPFDSVMFQWLFIPSLFIWIFGWEAMIIKLGSGHSMEEFEKDLKGLSSNCSRDKT